MTTNTLSTDDADKILLDKLNAEVVNFDHRSKSHVVSDHRFTPSQIKRSLQRLFPKLKVSVQRKKVRLGAESPDALYKAVIKAVINANVIKRLNR